MVADIMAVDGDVMDVVVGCNGNTRCESKSSTFGSELVALRICKDLIIALRYK